MKDDIITLSKFTQEENAKEGLKRIKDKTLVKTENF